MPPLDDRMRCHVNDAYDKEVTLARVESMDSGYPVDSVSSSDTCLQNLFWLVSGAAGASFMATKRWWERGLPCLPKQWRACAG